MTDPNVYPPGWDAKRVQEVINYYDSMTDDDLAAEIAAAGAGANPNDRPTIILDSVSFQVPVVEGVAAGKSRNDGNLNRH